MYKLPEITILLLCLFISATYAQDDKGKQPANQNNGMASDDDAKKAIDEFEKQIGKLNSAKEEDKVISAIVTLGGTKNPKVLDELMKKGAKNYKFTNKEKTACVDEIKKYTNDKTAAGYISDVFDSNCRSKDTKDIAISALGALGVVAYEPCAKDINKLLALDGKDDDITVAAIEATGTIRSKTSIEPLIVLLKKCESILASIQAQQTASAAQTSKNPPPTNGGKSGAGGNQAKLNVYKQQNNMTGSASKADVEQQSAQKLSPEINKALASITKQAFNTGKDWGNWWANNKNTFKIQ